MRFRVSAGRFPLAGCSGAGGRPGVVVDRASARESAGGDEPDEYSHTRTTDGENPEQEAALLGRDPERTREVMTRRLGHVRGLWAAH
ncbi:hypothetical protein ACIRVK_36425 [Streptomyces sp. NPDC101152]|uniref:hypothetical protein n=1 Tax=Streptomyces sp. NPDC101152 TaxID=3366116 RepID=UPI00382831BC